MRRMTAAGFLTLPAEYRLGSPDKSPRALTRNPDTGATELWPVAIAAECWHRLFVAIGPGGGMVWEIQRLYGGGEYRILGNLTEAGTRRWAWCDVRLQLLALSAVLCPDPDEPQVTMKEQSFVVTHGSRSCELKLGVVASEEEAMEYAAALFARHRRAGADCAPRTAEVPEV